MNLVRHIIEHAILGVGGGGGGGNTLRFYDEGVYKGTFGEVDIIGINHNAEVSAPGRIGIYSPSQVFSPKYNSGAATVPDISLTNRNVAAPTVEGTPFGIGDWIAGSIHGCINTGSWNFNTPSPCGFEDTSSTIEVNVYDADGVSLLAQHITAAISGITDVTVNNIRIQVTAWASEGIKYRGNILVSVATSLIIPAGGRCSVEIIHHNGGTDYTKSQAGIFYDPNPNAATVNTPTMAEGGTVLTKNLSGVPFYILGSQFQIDLTDIDYVNADSYLAGSLVDIDGSEYGLTALLLGSGDLTGWVNAWNDQNDTYQKTNWAITAANFRAITTLANIQARAKDWTDQAWQLSANAAILIDTWLQESGPLAEYFTDEAYRRTAADGVWDSSQNLVTYDGGAHAQVVGGILRVPNVNYSLYMPANTRNYLGLTGNINFYRRIIDVAGLVRTSCSFNISGFTLADLVANRVELWVWIPGKWASWCYAHTASLFNFGTFDGDNDPIRLASSISNRIDVSFGTLGLDAGNTYFRMRIVINDASITPDSVVVTW